MRSTTDDPLLSAWLLDREAVDLDALPALAQDGQLGPPDLQLQSVASRGAVLTVQLSGSGTPPPPGALLYVERRGAFEVLRQEPWPEGRVLLVLGAWPRR